MLLVRRFTIISALDGAFRLYREWFGGFFVLSLVVSAPAVAAIFGMGLLSESLINSGWLGLNAAALSTAGGHVGLASFVVGWAVTCGMAACAHMTNVAASGGSPTAREAIACVLRKTLPLVGVSMVAAVATLVAGLLLIIPGIIVAVALSWVAPIVIIEGAGARRAVARSWQLTRGRRWKVLVTELLVLSVWAATAGGIGVIGVFAGVMGDGVLSRTVQLLLLQALATFAMPVGFVSLVLLYYDARVDAEAFDVQILVRRAWGAGRVAAHAGSR